MNQNRDAAAALLEREALKLHWSALFHSRRRRPPPRRCQACEQKGLAAAARTLPTTNLDASKFSISFDRITTPGKKPSRRSWRPVFVSPPRDPETDAKLLFMWREFVDFAKEYLQRHHEFEVLQYLLRRSEGMPAAIAEPAETLRPLPAGAAFTPRSTPRPSSPANPRSLRLPQHPNLPGPPPQPFKSPCSPLSSSTGSPLSNSQRPPRLSNSQAPQKPGLLLALPPLRQPNPNSPRRSAA